MPTSIDGFPADTGRSDELIQRDIDEQLRNCEALRGTHATKLQRFPKWFLLPPATKAAWTIPLLERTEWNIRNGSAGNPWLEDVATLLDLALRDATSLPDGALAQLARVATILLRAGREQPLETLATLLQNRKKPVEGELLRETHLALREAGARNGQGVYKLAWVLFLAPESPEETGTNCWSAVARGSLRDMALGERKAWDGLWSGAATRKAVEQIGLLAFETRFREWLAPLQDGRPHELSLAGETLLRHLLLAVSAVPALKVDEPLYWLAGARWSDASKAAFWLNAFVDALATRPKTQAAACAEMLAQNPDTSSLVGVQRLYASQMTSVVEEPGIEQIIDRMLQDSRMPQASEMMAGQKWTGGTQKMAVATAVQSAGSDLRTFFRALLGRTRGMAKDRSMEVGALIAAITEVLGRQPDLLTARGADAVQDFSALSEIDAVPQFGAFSNIILSAAEQRVDRYGYETELAPVLRAWHKSLHGSNTALDIRHKVEWLLWFDDVTPINEANCWSTAIQKDLRAMTPELRERWIALHRNVSFALVEKPPAKWKKPAEKLFSELGAPAFRDGVRRWFQPFRDRTPLKLTVRGRDVLRNLMWYALVAKDAQVDEALAWFATATWKTKDAKSYTAKLLPTWAYVLGQRSSPLAVDALETYSREGGLQLEGKTFRMYQEYCEASGKAAGIAPPPAPAPPPGMSELVMQAAGKSLLALGMAVRVENDAVRVKGQLDEYVISIKDGGITRVSDGRSVRLAIDTSDGPYRHFKAALDGPDIHGQPNMIRVMACARILQNDAAERDKIVVE